jgi:outer membrane protein assembly factor BamB
MAAQIHCSIAAAALSAARATGKKAVFWGQNPQKCRTALLLLLLAIPAQADWPHYRGPTQNGVSTDTHWTPAPLGHPRTLWRLQLGKGTSSVVTGGGRAYSMGNVDGKDVVYCIDPKTGKNIWRHEYPMTVDPNLFEGGPRSTPVLDGDRLYALSHQGDLWCLDAATGKKRWYTHFQQEFGGQRADWGYAGSPLVAGNLLLCDVGGRGASTVALDKMTGKPVWKSGSDKPGYASPVVATLGGTETVLVFKATALVAHALQDGRELWRYPWKTSYEVNAATPLVVAPDRVFIASGYNTGCALLQIRGGRPTELWRNKNLRAHMNTPTVHQDHLYGIDGDSGGGNLVCLSVANGERVWQEKTVKGGALILSGGKLIVFTERGELVICEASPAGFKPLSRAAVLTGRCWAQPTLDDTRVYLRNNNGELACVELK